MLKKEPKRSSFFRKVGRGFVILTGLELLCFTSCYIGYRKLNQDQEFRHRINQEYPQVLDLYYRVGEMIGNSKVREYDKAIWTGRK